MSENTSEEQIRQRAYEIYLAREVKRATRFQIGLPRSANLKNRGSRAKRHGPQPFRSESGSLM
jgi:hypothetical protein